MSDTEVRIPFGDNPSETATLLLAAAEEVREDQSVVRTAEGAFVAPRDVADRAGVDYDRPDDEPESDNKPTSEQPTESDDQPDEEPPKKKAPSKKAAKRK